MDGGVGEAVGGARRAASGAADALIDAGAPLYAALDASGHQKPRMVGSAAAAAAAALAPLAPLAVQTAAGAAAYGATLAAAQGAAMVLRLSCATPVLGPVAGAAAVCTASVAAGQAASVASEALVSGDAGAAVERRARAIAVALDRTSRSKQARLMREELATDAVIGAVAFRLFGGRLRALLPSDLARPGAYAMQSVPAAGADYASDAVKRQLHTIYGKHGCHTCGTKKSPMTVIADHMPPNVLVYGRGYKNPDTVRGPLEQLSLWFKGVTTQQRFYPQCQPCSNAQGKALLKGVRVLKMHTMDVRPILASGAAVGTAINWSHTHNPATLGGRAVRQPNLRRRHQEASLSLARSHARTEGGELRVELKHTITGALRRVIGEGDAPARGGAREDARRRLRGLRF